MKKMRKLVPAFAMLMVAAIMMSTASFAWFTMNEEVTASGMQIQAQATGSLVIKENAPLKFNDTKATVNFTSGVSKLQPITLDKDTGLWYKATKDNKVDVHTGMYTGSLTETAPASNTNYVEKTVYIASAGNALEKQQLTITLGDEVHPADSLIYKAYSAAIYVVEKADGTWANVTANSKPDAILNLTNTTTNTVTLTKNGAGYTVPSIAGVETDAAAVGIKVVIRFFVDGDLDADGTDTMTVPSTTKHTSAEGALLTYDETKNYYNADGTPFNPTGYVSGTTTLPVGTYWIENTTVDTTEFKYVNSDDIPVAYTEMSVSFSTAAINP